MTNASMRARSGLLTWSLVLATLASMLGAGVAAAADPTPPQDSSSGTVGRHLIVESTDAPGATCRYGYEVEGVGYYNGLRRLGVRPPRAFAYRQRASQRITWRLVVQGWDGSAWTRYRSSGWQSGVATPRKPASFMSTSLLTDPWTDAIYGQFRARLQLRWHAPDGRRVVGRAALHPRFYRWAEKSLADYVSEERCSSTTG